MKISLVYIAKNEENTLPRSIQSFAGVYDELIVCDTGSVDKTVEIAQQFGAKVVHFDGFIRSSDPKTRDTTFEGEPILYKDGKPQFSFALARNFACKEATGDWVVMVDCDEWLPEGQGPILKNMLQRTPENIDLILIRDHSFVEGQQTPVLIHFVNRLFRNRPGIRWMNTIHETLNVPGERAILSDDVCLFHKKEAKVTPEAEAVQSRRTELYIEGLVEDIKASPKDPRPIFYLANTYKDTGRFKEAIPWYKKYLKISDWKDERWQATYNLAVCYWMTDEKDKCRDLLVEALDEDYRRAEGYILLGDYYLEKQEWDQARHWYLVATTCPLPNSLLFLNGPSYQQEPWDKLCLVYDKLGMWEKGLQAAKKTAEYLPNEERVLKNIQYFHNQLNKRTPVAVVIPSRTPLMVQRAIRSIKKAGSRTPYAIIVACDGKDFTGWEWLIAEYPDVTFVLAPPPFVFSRSVNLGIRWAEYADIIVMNDDVEVETENWIDTLRAIAYSPQSDGRAIGMVAPLNTDCGNVRQTTYARDITRAWVEEPESLMFVCVYIRRDVINAVGLMDESFVWYGYEDNDYCYRVRRIGCKLAIAQNAIVKHRRHSTFGAEGWAEFVQPAAWYFQQKWSAPKELDVVYFSHNRLNYTQRTLPQLLKNTTHPSARIIVVDNASNPEVVKYLKSIRDPRLMLFLNPNNEGIGAVLNRIWVQSTAKYIAKVDNDTLVPEGWAEALIAKLEADEKLAVVHGFHFMPEDFDAARAAKNVENGVLLQPWVGGCSYVLKADVVKRHGGVPVGEWKLGGWTEYQQALSNAGYKIGYVVDPMVKVENLDDPRHPETQIDPAYLMQMRNMTVAQAAEWYKQDAEKLLYGDYPWTRGEKAAA